MQNHLFNSGQVLMKRMTMRFIHCLMFGLLCCLLLVGCEDKKTSWTNGAAPEVAVPSYDLYKLLYASRSQPATYEYVAMELPSLWIQLQLPQDGSTQLGEPYIGTDGRLQLQLDGISFPIIATEDDGASMAAMAPIEEAMEGVLSQNKKIRVVPSSWTYSGPGQIGGVIYLADGTTLQGFLLAQGLARLDRPRMENPLLAGAFNEDLVAYWTRFEDQARQEQRGYWKTHHLVMSKTGQLGK